jgi:pimeloyl-ACP methyl ester carboxylesterase
MSDYGSGKPLRPNLFPSATMPTLFIVGGTSEPFFLDGATTAADQLSNARVYSLPGQSHGVESHALAPVLADFFAA